MNTAKKLLTAAAAFVMALSLSTQAQAQERAQQAQQRQRIEQSDVDAGARRPDRAERGERAERPDRAEGERFDRSRMIRMRMERVLAAVDRSDPNRAEQLREMRERLPLQFVLEINDAVEEMTGRRQMLRRGRRDDDQAEGPEITTEEIRRLMQRIERISQERAEALIELGREDAEQFRQIMAQIKEQLEAVEPAEELTDEQIDERAEQLLERLQQQNPVRAERLRRLREEDPERFRQMMAPMIEAQRSQQRDPEAQRQRPPRRQDDGRGDSPAPGNRGAGRRDRPND